MQYLFYTIAEVSEILNIPKHTLRYWEKHISQLRIVRHNNRRRYTTQDLELLKMVRFWTQEESITLKVVIARLNQKQQNKAVKSSGASEDPLPSEPVIRPVVEQYYQLVQIKRQLKSAKALLQQLETPDTCSTISTESRGRVI